MSELYQDVLKKIDHQNDGKVQFLLNMFMSTAHAVEPVTIIMGITIVASIAGLVRVCFNVSQNCQNMPRQVFEDLKIRVKNLNPNYVNWENELMILKRFLEASKTTCGEEKASKRESNSCAVNKATFQAKVAVMTDLLKDKDPSRALCSKGKFGLSGLPVEINFCPAGGGRSTPSSPKSPGKF